MIHFQFSLIFSFSNAALTHLAVKSRPIFLDVPGRVPGNKVILKISLKYQPNLIAMTVILEKRPLVTEDVKIYSFRSIIIPSNNSI